MADSGIWWMCSRPNSQKLNSKLDWYSCDYCNVPASEFLVCHTYPDPYWGWYGTYRLKLTFTALLCPMIKAYFLLHLSHTDCNLPTIHHPPWACDITLSVSNFGSNIICSSCTTKISAAFPLAIFAINYKLWNYSLAFLHSETFHTLCCPQRC